MDNRLREWKYPINLQRIIKELRLWVKPKKTCEGYSIYGYSRSEKSAEVLLNDQWLEDDQEL